MSMDLCAKRYEGTTIQDDEMRPTKTTDVTNRSAASRKDEILTSNNISMAQFQVGQYSRYSCFFMHMNNVFDTDIYWQMINQSRAGNSIDSLTNADIYWEMVYQSRAAGGWTYIFLVITSIGTTIVQSKWNPNITAQTYEDIVFIEVC
jgi:hypothetical protein